MNCHAHTKEIGDTDYKDKFIKGHRMSRKGRVRKYWLKLHLQLGKLKNKFKLIALMANRNLNFPCQSHK